MKRLAALALLCASAAHAQITLVNTGQPNGQMAMASRPASPGKIEIEAADDFLLGSSALITGGSFIGLLPGGAPLSSIASVTVEIYRIFPLDSDVGRTSGPPTFSTPLVPTRVNSPSDVELDGRSTGAGLTFTAALLSGNFSASNSVLNGINPKPGQTTGGDGAVSGEEVQIAFTLTSPITLPADHYFFVPQVQLTNGDFYWLSSVRPITGAGTTPFNPDLQAWIRNANLDPDWLRVGTDIVGGTTPPTFNAAFTLTGTPIPEPSAVALLTTGLAGLALARRRRRT